MDRICRLLHPFALNRVFETRGAVEAVLHFNHVAIDICQECSVVLACAYGKHRYADNLSRNGSESKLEPNLRHQHPASCY